MYKRVDEVLHYIWDPIGVSTMSPIPRDEYHTYLPQVFGMVIDGKPEEEIAAYLLDIERDRMGLDPRNLETRPRTCATVAKILVESWAELRDYYDG
jgi:hypothetical protein